LRTSSRRRSTCSRRPPASTTTSTFSSARCSDSSTYMHRCRPGACRHMQRQTQQREATAGIAALASRSSTLHLQAGYSDLQGPIDRHAGLSSFTAHSTCSCSFAALRQCEEADRPSDTVIGSRAFSIAAPTVWNALPDNVVNAASLTIFKKHLKTHLFDCC